MATRRFTGWRSLMAIVVCASTVSGCTQWRMPRIDPSGERFFIFPSQPPAPCIVPAQPAAPCVTPSQPAAPCVTPSQPTPPGVVAGGAPAPTIGSAPQLSLRKSGPAVGTVGATLTYRIELRNSGNQAANQVVLADAIPEGWACLSSNPPAALANRQLNWNVGQMPPGATQSFEVNLRADRAGGVTVCAEAVAAPGLRTRDCVTTTVTAPTAPPAAGPTTPSPVAPRAPAAAIPRVDLQLGGPNRATVGDTVAFEIAVTNVGEVPATGLILRDEFEPGLEHKEAPSPIERSLGVDLAPGQSQRIAVKFQVTRPGLLCHTVIVTGNGGIRTSKKACVEAVAKQPSPSPPPQWPAPQLPGQTPVQPAPERQAPPQQPPGQPSAVAPPSPSTKQAPATQPSAAQPAPATQPSTTQPPAPQPPASQPPATPPAAAAPKGQVRVLLYGPPQPLNVGDMAEFHIQVSNPGTVALTNVKVVATADPSLELAEASRGYAVANGQLVWTVDSMPPNGPLQKFQLNCRCKQASPRACVRVSVSTANPAEDSREACFEIRSAIPPARGSNLDLTIIDLREPIAVGKEETYEITLTNRGKVADDDVVLKVTLPPQMSLDQLQTSGPGGGYEKVEGQTVQFKKVARLFPNAIISYRVVALANQPGKVQVTATVTSKNVKELSGTQSTEIFAEK